MWTLRIVCEQVEKDWTGLDWTGWDWIESTTGGGTRRKKKGSDRLLYFLMHQVCRMAVNRDFGTFPKLIHQLQPEGEEGRQRMIMRTRRGDSCVCERVKVSVCVCLSVWGREKDRRGGIKG